MMMEIELNLVIVSRSGGRWTDVSYDDSAFEYASETIRQHLSEGDFDNAKFVLMEARGGNHRTAVERLIKETGDGRISSDVFVIVRHPTIEVPVKDTEMVKGLITTAANALADAHDEDDPHAEAWALDNLLANAERLEEKHDLDLIPNNL